MSKDNKYSILGNGFSGEDKFSDRLLYKSNIYPLVKDSMWKCMMSFERPQYVSYLISSLFDLDYNYVLENLKEVNFVLPKYNVEEAVKTVGFVCKIDDVTYLIELNNQPKDYVFRRNMDYLYKVAGSDRESGKNEYTKIKAVNINNFSCENLSKEEQNLYHAGMNGNKFIELGDDFEIKFIFLPYLKKTWYTISKLKNIYEKEKLIKELKDWEKFLLVTLLDDSENLRILLRENTLFKKYRKEAKKMTKDEYQHYMDLAVKANEKMYRQIEKDAEVRGETRGKTEGKDEEKIATARKMKECNESIDKIKLYTGLSTEKIKSISI